jgi:hypothetical protein
MSRITLSAIESLTIGELSTQRCEDCALHSLAKTNQSHARNHAPEALVNRLFSSLLG